MQTKWFNVKLNSQVLKKMQSRLSKIGGTCLTCAIPCHIPTCNRPLCHHS